MSEQYCGCLDKMSEVNFSRAETLQPLFFYRVLTPISTTSSLWSTAIRINTSKSTYTFTSTVKPRLFEVPGTAGILSNNRGFSDIFGKARMLSKNAIVLPEFATSTHVFREVIGTSAKALKKMSSLEVVASSSLMLCRSKNAEN